MPRDGTATRTRILDAAEHLVIENGYAATSVDQVLADSSTSKGAFFHHFASKRELAKALVDRYVEADIAQLRRSLDATDHLTDPAARALGILRFFEDAADEIIGAQSNCLYVAVLTERELVVSGTSAEIVRAVATWRAEISALLRQALADREHDGLDPEALADHLFVTFEGAYLLCRSTGDPGHMRAQLRVFRMLLENVLSWRSLEAGGD